METAALKKFAQGARRQLLEQVAARLEQVLRSDSIEIREKAKVVDELREQIKEHGKKAVVDRVAYTWFNRFCALRYMDVNNYTRVGIVSPVEGFTQPEILQEAKQGHIDDDFGRYINCPVVFDLLNGRRPSSDAQGEAFRLLLVGVCNYYGEFMPFMFEKIEDYTELLMPLDLLSENSVLHDLRQALTPEACLDVEVIGWLYQYYISERKDEVFEALKQNQKIEAQDIPAATQLFTPHWIVCYLVENSLGRLWMLNHPNSKLREKMEYYIDPRGSVIASPKGEANSSQQEIASSLPSVAPRNDTTTSVTAKNEAVSSSHEETDFLKISSPEEIKLLDPACGSGHILTYAFDLLYAIYEEEGYASNDIPKLILERNIFGVEIDGRAGALAAFALTMKARAKDRRFISRGVLPNICVMENVTFNESELKQYMDAVGRDLFTEPLLQALHQFEQATTFGSLIRPMLIDAGYVRGLLEGKNLGGDLFLFGVHERVLKVLKQAEFLAPRYQAVVANPPYMSARKGMNLELKNFLEEHFEVGKQDLFSAFTVMMTKVVISGGFLGLMMPVAWMFLSSFEDLRKYILEGHTITNLVRPEYHAFFDSAYVYICAFTLFTRSIENLEGSFIDLSQFYGADIQHQKTLDAINNPNCPWLYKVRPTDLKKIPGAPIAYWVSEKVRNVFEQERSIGELIEARQGLGTGEDSRFFRFHWEVSHKGIGFEFSSAQDGWEAHKKWFPLNKGGSFRKWYGNQEYVIAFDKHNRDLLKGLGNHLPSENKYFQPCISWSDITNATNSFRMFDRGFLFSNVGHCAFPKSKRESALLLCYCNNKFVNMVTNLLNPTMHFPVGYFNLLPYPSKLEKEIERLLELFDDLVSLAKIDWDSFETSWNFIHNPLLMHKTNNLVSQTYVATRQNWQDFLWEMQKLEQENNQIFIETYDLQEEFTCEVGYQEITLNSNPHFRYGGNKTEDELEFLLLTDTMKEFISYAVGCMFGRYSLDKPGLVLANQGETLKDYLKQVPKPTFTPDEDNAIPVLEGEWFNDDIAERFKKFLRVTFGEEHYDENLAFIEEAIGRDIRSYFVKEFYKNHVQTYKKRPIYWMFSSPKGSFNVLIYMHRYQPDTVSIVLNSYLREYIKKLNAHKSELERTSVSGSTSQGQKTKALKEITQVNKVLFELKEYEETLFKLASQRIQIDLDDGVKVNYGKFGSALSPIKGL